MVRLAGEEVAVNNIHSERLGTRHTHSIGRRTGGVQRREVGRLRRSLEDLCVSNAGGDAVDSLRDCGGD